MRRRAVSGGARVELLPDAWCRWYTASPYIVCAIVHGEDPLFFRHRGFWWIELRRQVRRAWTTRTAVRGVSTITQQLARNLFLQPERSLRRKIQEALITAQIESSLSKPRILELYMNVVELGVDVWGVEAAATHYFGRPVDQLGPFAAVFLTSLLPAPRAALRDANARRAIRAQRRLTSLLYGSGVIGHTSEKQTYGYIDELETIVSSGGDITNFLRAAAGDDGRGCGRDDVPWPATSALIRSECGLAQRTQYEQFLRSASSYIRGIRAWPEWWSAAS